MTMGRLAIGAVAVLALVLIAPLLGLALMAVLLVVGFVLWLLEGPEARPCPRCGEDVPNGQLACDNCQFDFHTIGADRA